MAGAQEPDDEALRSAYRAWEDKGPVIDGVRLTLMTDRLSYRAGEPVRIVHVADHTGPGRPVYVMGPKRAYDEYVDGELAGAPTPEGEDGLAPSLYDGPVLSSPLVDVNYEITSYPLEPGEHEIRWEPGQRRSNVLRVQVAPSSRA